MSIEKRAIRVMPLATIKQRRTLPMMGRVVVNQGQIVTATATVAEAHVEARYHVVDVAQSLKVSRKEADDYITCEAGHAVRKDDVLAQKKGLILHVVRAPVDGEIVVIGEGQVLIREYRPPWELRAGVPGKISKVYPNRGVEIETKGSVIDGVWGNGKTGYGLLHAVATAPDEPLTPASLSVELRGLVLVGGHLDNPKTLSIATELPARALIVGTMRAAIIPYALQMPFPVLVIDGFGSKGMNPLAFRLLSTSTGREAAVLAENPSPYKGQYPSVIIPLSSADFPPEPPSTAPLEAGTMVRIVRAPYPGEIGHVVAVKEGWLRFPNGARAPAVDVRLENGSLVTVPVANVEILIQS